MKFLVGFLVLGFVATVLARPEINRAQVKESKDRMKAAHEKCQKDPATAIPEPPQGAEEPSGPPTGPPSPIEAAHVLCISKSLGWQNEDGSINKANIEARASAIFGHNENLQAIVDECAVAKESPEITAQHLIHCYRKHSPKPPKPQN